MTNMISISRLCSLAIKTSTYYGAKLLDLSVIHCALKMQKCQASSGTNKHLVQHHFHFSGKFKMA